MFLWLRNTYCPIIASGRRKYKRIIAERVYRATDQYARNRRILIIFIVFSYFSYLYTYIVQVAQNE